MKQKWLRAMRVAPVFVIAAVFAAILGSGVAANAAVITWDCTTGCDPLPNETFGGALWRTASVQPSGTGVFKPFVRMIANGQATDEDGHNTDANPVNDEFDAWTSAVLIADLDNFVLIGGTAYAEFVLDLGEPANVNMSKLSLDAVKICRGATGNLTMVGDCPTTALFDLDAGADRSVLLDYNLFGGGNGNSDLFMYIPLANFRGSKEPYFYLYTAFGYQPNHHADGTFEEWAYQ